MTVTAVFERLELSSPWMNASGFLGFSPPAASVWSEPMGAFVTSPISLAPRSPAQARQAVSYPGGLLLHTGWPNPGFQRVVKQNAEKWRSLTTPVWVHLLPQSPSELPGMIQHLETLENVSAIELGIPPETSLKTTLDFIQAAAGELPVMVCLALDEFQDGWLEPLKEAGASGLVVCAPRGTMKVHGQLIRGRLYGPAVFPQMLNAVEKAAKSELPMVASGGVFNFADGIALLDAGVSAVQLDAVLWSIAEI
jgi:dihydroorotate dehydrogenase (NAD+) catalytic subunit